VAITWPLFVNVIRRRSLNHTFGWVRKYANGSPKPHQGWDLEATVGTPVFSIAGGEVEFVRDLGDYGLQVCIGFQHNGATLYAFYGHLSSSTVSVNQKVEADDLIAYSGESGNARGMAAADQHVHLEIRTKAYAGVGLANRVSPLTVFGTCPLTQPIYG
jgi:murein DD-endopeptidase MepM/ murein hydrolase activator NlpD